ncbi:hypothetical protein OIU77_021582 [Salix suchowensis]|uniref:Rx N-terminal domain-containing protein n=1 Tax=Salix suchowensis TaxID=1278906 RepID=A0ABQ9CE93_9ROSI|nr:hypothetical protein OIU77_021582 [Salix suchowensis]
MDAERHQSQNEKIGFWLQKLREFRYDAEDDALDEFDKASGEKYREHWQKATPLLFKFQQIKDLNFRLAEIESMKSKFPKTMEENQEEESLATLSFRLLCFMKLPATRASPKQFLQASAGSSQTFSIGDCPKHHRIARMHRQSEETSMACDQDVSKFERKVPGKQEKIGPILLMSLKLMLTMLVRNGLLLF